MKTTLWILLLACCSGCVAKSRFPAEDSTTARLTKVDTVVTIDTTFHLIGTTKLRVPGDTATICAYASHWLARTAWRVRITKQRKLVGREDADVRNVCRPLLAPLGISPDSLQLHDLQWNVEYKLPSDLGKRS